MDFGIGPVSEHPGRPSGLRAQRAATAGFWLHQTASRSLPITSMRCVGIPAADASSVMVFSRSPSPFLPLVDPEATTTNHPPRSNVFFGKGLLTSPFSDAPACRTLPL